MGQFDRLLQRQPQIDAAVVEEVRARAMARLSAYSDPRPSTEAAESDDGTDGTADWDAEGHMGWRAEAPTEAHDSPVYGSDAALSAAAAQIEIVVVDHGEPIALPSFDPWLFPVGDQHDAISRGPSENAFQDRAEAEADADAGRSFEEYEPPLIRPMRRPATEPASSNGHGDLPSGLVDITHDESNGHADPSGSYVEVAAATSNGHGALLPHIGAVTVDASNGHDDLPSGLGETTAHVSSDGTSLNGTEHAAPPARPARRQPSKRPAGRSRSVATAYCPYCALPLDPPPTSDRRCTRCRQRIIVRRVASGLVVHLTEAALAVFDAERTREANIERWTSERRKWLELAGSAGASVHRVERLERSAASEESVQAARAFYLATVDHAVQEAVRRDLWEVAAQLRRGQAIALHRLAGRQVPPGREIRDLYREAAMIELRGIAGMARTAAVVGPRCCDVCRADDGTPRRVAAELRRARLPHEGCTKGLCRCRWDLSPRDVRMVQRYLVRTGRLIVEAEWPDPARDTHPIPESAPA
jgi:hypothetical protein